MDSDLCTANYCGALRKLTRCSEAQLPQLQDYFPLGLPRELLSLSHGAGSRSGRVPGAALTPGDLEHPTLAFSPGDPLTNVERKLPVSVLLVS